MVAARPTAHASLAPLLAAAGVPAILAMQGRISMVAELEAAKAAAARRALALVLQLCTEEPDIRIVRGSLNTRAYGGVRVDLPVLAQRESNGGRVGLLVGPGTSGAWVTTQYT